MVMVKSFDKSAVNSILIRSTNWLGDAVMTTPAIGAIRGAFPDARITILANPLVAELFSPHDWVDEVMVYDRKGVHAGLGGRLGIAAQLRARGFDLAILLQNAFDAALITWLARIPRRMGYRTDARGFLLTHGSPVTEASRRLHHVDYYLEMLKLFGINSSEKRLCLKVTPEEERAVVGQLSEAGIGAGDFVLGINPGATFGSAKRWYPERFAAVARALSGEWGARVVITGGSGEAAIAREIAEGLPADSLNLAGRTSVRTLMALLKRCDFLVTNDSGPMHIAAAFGVPTVAIFGPTDHTTTSPFSAKGLVVRQETDCAPCLKRECPTDHRCMAGVTVEAVVEAALGLRQEVLHG